MGQCLAKWESSVALDRPVAVADGHFGCCVAACGKKIVRKTVRKGDYGERGAQRKRGPLDQTRCHYFTFRSFLGSLRVFSCGEADNSNRDEFFLSFFLSSSSKKMQKKLQNNPNL